MFCKQCGAELEKEALFCSACGTKVEIVDNKIVDEKKEVIDNEDIVEECDAISEPVENKSVTNDDDGQKKPKGKKIGLIIGVIALIILAVLFMGGSKEKWVAESVLINGTVVPLDASDTEYYFEIKGDDFKLGMSDSDEVIDGNLIVLTEEGNEITYALKSYDDESMGFALRTTDEGKEVFYLMTADFEMIFTKK